MNQRKQLRMRRFMAAALSAVALAWEAALPAQAPKGRVTADSPKPPLTFHGLIPGLSRAEEVRKTLGPPLSEADWYAYKMVFPSVGRPGLTDSLHLSNKDGVFACAEAATIPDGYETREKIEAALGRPEFELRMATFTLLDYSAKGLRFILNRGDKAIGVAYFPRVRPRVHEGARRLIDLSSLRQGPQPPPENPASPEGLQVGVSEVKLTPLDRSWISPAYREAYNPHDDLWARCAVFEKDGLTVALVGADIFGISYSDIRPMIEAAREKGVEHLVFGMSHTHSAPDDIGVYGHYPAEHVQYIQQQVGAALDQARSSMRRVKELRAASRELPMDGARVIGLIRNARNPGLLDPTMSVLQAIGEDGLPICTLVNFACHPEGLEAGVVELSADFPGYLCAQVRKDGGGQPVFLNGALGGMVSGDSNARTHAETEKMGLAFAALAKELIATAQPPAEFEFKAETRRVEIPMTNEKFLPLFSEKRPLEDGRVVTEMTLFTLGECRMVTLPGEVLPEVSFEILEKMKGFPRMFIGLANDQLGYIIPPYDFRQDSYEESMSQGPAAAPVIRDTAILMLEGLE